MRGGPAAADLILATSAPSNPQAPIGYINGLQFYAVRTILFFVQSQHQRAAHLVLEPFIA